MKSLSNADKLRRRIAPGILVDADDMPHFSIPELLDLVQLEDTPDNRKRVSDMLKRLIKENNPEAEIIERHHP